MFTVSFFSLPLMIMGFQWTFNVLLHVLLRKRVMLMGVYKVIINNLFLKSFDTIFMKNGKNCQNINCFFLFLLS